MELIVGTPAPRHLNIGSWHLLADGGAHYFYVICEQSAVSFSIMVQLTPEEYVEYRALGQTFLQYLAEKVNWQPSNYSSRRVSRELQAAAEDAIAEASRD